MKLDPKELAKITYLRADVVGNRIVNLVPLWDGTGWQVWIPNKDGGLTTMRPAECIEGDYVAREPAREDDLHFPFMEIMWKRASWPETTHWVTAIRDDVHNVATALAKIDFFWTVRDQASNSVARFVKNEIEYVITVCRSMFDQLQEIIRCVWEHVTLLDEASQKRKKPLQKTFSKMVRRDERLMSAAEIAQYRHVPESLATAYAEAAPFLGALRSLRDRAVHGGHDAPFVFVTDRGFAIGKHEPYVAALPNLKPEYDYSDRLISLRPVLAHLVMTTLYICNGFGDLMSKIIVLPDDLAPDYHLFIRSAHGAALTRSQRVLRGEASPWWTDP